MEDSENEEPHAAHPRDSPHPSSRSHPGGMPLPPAAPAFTPGPHPFPHLNSAVPETPTPPESQAGHPPTQPSQPPPQPRAEAAVEIAPLGSEVREGGETARETAGQASGQLQSGGQASCTGGAGVRNCTGAPGSSAQPQNGVRPQPGNTLPSREPPAHLPQLPAVHQRPENGNLGIRFAASKPPSERAAPRHGGGLGKPPPRELPAGNPSRGPEQARGGFRAAPLPSVAAPTATRHALDVAPSVSSSTVPQVPSCLPNLSMLRGCHCGLIPPFVVVWYPGRSFRMQSTPDDHSKECCLCQELLENPACLESEHWDLSLCSAAFM